MQVGDLVKAGDVLFYDKNNDLIKFTSPVSGVIQDIIRGNPKRFPKLEIFRF